jgi:hypothetical protein
MVGSSTPAASLQALAVKAKHSQNWSKLILQSRTTHMSGSSTPAASLQAPAVKPNAVKLGQSKYCKAGRPTCLAAAHQQPACRHLQSNQTQSNLVKVNIAKQDDPHVWQQHTSSQLAGTSSQSQMRKAQEVHNARIIRLFLAVCSSAAGTLLAINC